jgi:hypothetical protein
MNAVAKKRCDQCGEMKVIATNRGKCQGCRHLNMDLASGKVRPPSYTETNVAHYKEPMQKVGGGFGYYGAITETNDGRQIQCHQCGYFFANIGAHVTRKHGLNVKEYKATYGLRLTEGLLSPVQRSEAQARYNKTNRKSPEDYAAMSAKGQVVLKKKGYQPGGNTWAPQTRNEKGMCREQTIAKVKHVAALGNGAPTYNLFVAEYGHGQMDTIRHWFGSWAEAVKAAGFTSFHENKAKARAELKEQTLENMAEFYLKEGHTPQTADFNSDNNLISQKTVTKLFGSLNNARTAAGVPTLMYLKGQWLEIVPEMVAR